MTRIARSCWLQRAAGVAGLIALTALTGCGGVADAPERGPYALLLDGASSRSEQTQLRAEAQRQSDARKVTFTIVNVDRIEDLGEQLRALARSDVRMVFVQGERFDALLQRIAWEFPRQRFTSLQGRMLRPNLALYRLREEDLSWLAGWLAARVSRSHRIARMTDWGPDAMGRSGLPEGVPDAAERAFTAGARNADPNVIVVSAPVDVARIPALAQRDVDVVYAAVDPADPTVAAAFKEASMRLIGHAPTRPASYPDWLVASGRSDPALLLSAALTDIRDAVWRGDLERSFGLRRPDALQLQPSPALSPLIAAELQSRIDDILAARIQVAPAPQGSAGRATTRPGSGAASSLPPSGAHSPTTGPGAGEPAPANH